MTLTETTLGGLTVTPVTEMVRYINILIYGDPGAGKTVLAGSADNVPEMRPVLFVDIEGGTLSLRKRSPDVHVVRIQNWKEFAELYNGLLAEDHGYRTVVLDSLTEIQKFHMYNVMQNVVIKDSERDPDVPSMREWAKNIEVMRKTVRGFRDLPMHTVFTALAKADKDGSSGKIVTKPYMSGKLANEVAGFVDIVGFLYTKVSGGDIQRNILFAATDRQVAKDRTDSLPSVLESPTMEAIFGHVLSEERE